MDLEVANAAIRFVGTKFSHQGRVPGVRLDCIGVVVCAHLAAGYPVSDYTAYGPRPNPKQLLKHISAQAEQVEEPEYGDLVLTWIKQPINKMPHHAAIITPAPEPYGEGLWMVHAHQQIRRVSHIPYDEIWRNNTHSVWRWQRQSDKQ